MSILSEKIVKNPSNFLYVFATKAFLSKLDKRTRDIIVVKQAYQAKVLVNESGGTENYNQAIGELKQVFVEQYAMQPIEALYKLAAGETVAGKNWAQGVYGVAGAGVGAQQTYFTGTDVTCDPTTGTLNVGGSTVSGTPIYGKNKKNNNIIGYAYTGADGTTYCTAYSKLKGSYYCNTSTTKDGVIKKANGSLGVGADYASIWESIQSNIECIAETIKKVLESLNLKLEDNEKLLNEEEIAPSQKDGFVEEDNTPSWLPWAIGGGMAITVAAAAGVIGSKKGLFKKSKKRK